MKNFEFWFITDLEKNILKQIRKIVMVTTNLIDLCVNIYNSVCMESSYWQGINFMVHL
jgi:hypothetical protein